MNSLRLAPPTSNPSPPPPGNTHTPPATRCLPIHSSPPVGQMEDTVALVEVIASTGVAAVAVHGRKRHERPRHACDTAAIRRLAELFPDLPIIAKLLATPDPAFQ